MYQDDYHLANETILINNNILSMKCEDFLNDFLEIARNHSLMPQNRKIPTTAAPNIQTPGCNCLNCLICISRNMIRNKNKVFK